MSRRKRCVQGDKLTVAPGIVMTGVTVPLEVIVEQLMVRLCGKIKTRIIFGQT